MLESIPNASQGFIELKAKFANAWSYDQLTEIETATRNLEATNEISSDLALLIGEIMRRKLDWNAAADYLTQKAEFFPECLELLYNASLAFIDGASYNRAQDVIKKLSAQLEKLTNQQLRGIWRAAPLVSLHETALEAFNLARARGEEACLASVEDRLVQALHNSCDKSLAAISVISIGENCLPWSVGQRWGLRSADRMFEQESPFNLAQTVTNSVSELLEKNFDQLLSSEYLSISKAADGTSRPLNNHYRFDFNHERGNQFIDDDFSGLKTRYGARVEKLRSHFEHKPCVLVHFTEREGDLGRLSNAIQKSFTHQKWHLLLLDAWNGPRSTEDYGNRTSYQKIVLPREDYQWFRPDHWDSNEGTAFENFLHDKIMENVNYVKQLL